MRAALVAAGLLNLRRGPDVPPASRARPPPPLVPGALRVVALGGLGEIGRNMAVLEYDGRLLVIDCGVLFPEDHQPGVDLILPDFEYIADRLDDVEALVLTHGHEDHIGAVPYLLRLRPDIPVVGSQLTLAFVEAKLKEHRITPLTLGGARGAGGAVRAVRVRVRRGQPLHPRRARRRVRTAAGTVLHTGDFKMDQLPLDGRITDLRAFARLGEAGVDLFMVDSTNAEVPGFIAPEREIGPVLDSVFAGAEQRIIVASFASHVHRVQQVLDAAHAHGRKVALVGRSMVRNMRIAADLGYLTVPDGVLVDARAVDDLPPHEVVLMCTGSQGEPMAALSRMAKRRPPVEVGARRHRRARLLAHPGQRERRLPGHQRAHAARRDGGAPGQRPGARLRATPSAGELIYCYNILRPRNVMPVHGEVRHLVANGAIAVRTGVPAERVLLAEDGVVVDLATARRRSSGPCRAGTSTSTARASASITEVELKDRRILGEEGFISIFVVVDSATGKVMAGPQIHARGVRRGRRVFDAILPEVVAALEEAARRGVDTHQLQQVVRRVVGRWVSGRLRRRPMIIPVVVEA